MSVAALALGCGTPAAYPVKGRVHYADGTPVTLGRIVVDPDATGKVGSWGSIREDGTFEMGTFSHNDGVPPGKWRVMIDNAFTQPPPGYNGTWISKPLVHRKYTSVETSGLTFEVPAQREWDITVEKP